MFLRYDSFPSNASRAVGGFDRVQHNLVKQTSQCRHRNLDLVNNIAQRQRLEEPLSQSEDKYRRLFENAAEGIFQATLDGRYLIANSSLASIYGYESTSQLITNLTDIKHQLYVDPQRHRELIKLLHEQERISKFESQVYCQDGSTIWISENVWLVRDDQGVPLYCEGFVTDITERKLTEVNLQKSEEQLKVTLQKLQQTQSQLIQSEKLSSLGQMVAGVAHEINNPVSFVCGNLMHASQYAEDLLNLLELYQKHYPYPVPEIEEEAEAIDVDFMTVDFRKTLSSMQVGSDRIRQIVQSLKNFSRMDEDQMKPIDLHAGIESTLLILHNRIKAAPGNLGITILKEYGKLPQVECYGNLINQVLMNLFSNAIDALEEQRNKGDSLSQNSQISIRTEVIDRNWASIRIADNGSGIPEEVKARIFDPFFTTKPVGKGTGLGLSISYQIIVEKHGGHLKCISTPEQGTEFVIEIPLRHS